MVCAGGRRIYRGAPDEPAYVKRHNINKHRVETALIITFFLGALSDPEFGVCMLGISFFSSCKVAVCHFPRPALKLARVHLHPECAPCHRASEGLQSDPEALVSSKTTCLLVTVTREPALRGPRKTFYPGPWLQGIGVQEVWEWGLPLDAATQEPTECVPGRLRPQAYSMQELATGTLRRVFFFSISLSVQKLGPWTRNFSVQLNLDVGVI